jgi:hypothetical protein
MTEIDTLRQDSVDEVNQLVADHTDDLNALDQLIKKDADAIINRVGLNMFDTVVKDHILTYEESKGLALQGTYVYKDAIAGSRYGYPDFIERCKKEKNEATATSVTLGSNTLTIYKHSNGHQFYNIADKSKVDAFYNTYGVADYYGIDEENNSVFLPRNKWFIQLTDSTANVNKFSEAGLPNITGSITGDYLFPQSGTTTETGALKLTGKTNKTHSIGGGGSIYWSDLEFDASRSNSNYGKSSTVQPKSSAKLLYYCVGNTVSDTSWIDVVTQVQGGVKDLEDKTQEGLNRLNTTTNNSIADIHTTAKSYDNLTHRNITNCLLEVPQRIKYTLENGTLTIKAGSVVIVPYGVEDLTAQYPVGSTFINDNFKVYDTQFADGKFFVHAELIRDISNTPLWGSAGLGFCFIDITSTEVASVLYNRVNSGATEPTREGSIGFWYDTVNNYNKRWSSSGFINKVVALPILTFNFDTLGSDNNYTASSVNQVFNGMGYIGSTVWVDKGVKGLIPNGRNADGTLNNIEAQTNELVTITYTTDIKGVHFGFSRYGDAGLNGAYSYDEKDNYVYNGKAKAPVMFCGTYDVVGGQITNFQPKLPFRAMDYIETYVNGTSWYRVWSNGWCEQGGKIVLNSGNVSGGFYNSAKLTLMKPFSKLISGHCQAQHDRFNAGFYADIGGFVSSIEVYQVNDSGGTFANQYVLWQVSGYTI